MYNILLKKLLIMKISMKKILLTFLIIWININTLEAKNIYEKELPLNFKSECFEFSSSYNFSSRNEGKYKIKINKEDTIAVKWNHLIPIISYEKLGNKLGYKSKVILNNTFLNDDNHKTTFSLDTEKNNEIILELDNEILKNEFELNFSHNAKDYYPTILISEDWIKYSFVSFSKLGDFDFKYFKITFNPRNKNNIKREIIKISELSFSKKEEINLIKVEWWWKVDFYNNYNCEDYINLETISVWFDIDINTPTVEIKMEKNKNYNPNIEMDVDLDKIENDLDNCPKIYNPLQKDSNWNWKGDKCSDIDWDWILWYLDNCPSIKNKNQLDLNLNNIGDSCEFDKDKDEIFDSVDNCVTVKNPFQKDSDNDWIWDKCDNCEFFNPLQSDKDNNGIWDNCDLRRINLEKNDDDKDWIINSADNCPQIANKDQKDWDKDWIWNSCDNCLFIKNNNQLDFDKNWVWDLCEDSDKDWIEWIKDNCINIYNKDQKDSDNNWIGDACEDKDFDDIWFSIDNCPYIYNPFQKDLDKDWIWDKCDKEDNRLIESNKNIFVAILLIVVMMFAWGIYFMIKKLNKVNEVEKKKKKKKKTKKNNWDTFEYLDWKSYTKTKKED